MTTTERERIEDENIEKVRKSVAESFLKMYGYHPVVYVVPRTPDVLRDGKNCTLVSFFLVDPRQMLTDVTLPVSIILDLVLTRSHFHGRRGAYVPAPASTVVEHLLESDHPFHLRGVASPFPAFT